MGKALIAIACLVIGLVTGGIGGAVLGVGGGAGIGIATGYSAGACGILEAAQAEGLLTGEEADRVFRTALDRLGDMTPNAAPAGGVTASAAGCHAAMARLREAAGE